MPPTSSSSTSGNTHGAYAAFCRDCAYLGPWHGSEEAALQDGFDHAFPGWRELVPVVAAMTYNETQNKTAYAQWRQSIVELYPAGWVEAGGPVLIARNRRGTRWHDDWFLGGNYNVCGVERAIDLHAPARHKQRTRLVAAAYQPRKPLPVVSPDGPVGDLTDVDIAAALSGIFTPGKLVGLGIALSDKVALRAWLKVRGQDSRDEHVGYRPAAPGRPPTFDTVTETREGLAAVVLTETERREGLIAWRQVAEYLRPALTPEACAHLSELHEAFQRLYTDPQREIEPTLSALHALRGQAAAIHQDAASANETKAVVAPAPTTQTAVQAENVLVAPPSRAARLPEDAESAPTLATVQPIDSPVPEPAATTQEPEEPAHETQQPQEPDYEWLYAEQFAQESRSSGQTQHEPERPAAGQASTAPTQPAPAPSPTATHPPAQPHRAKERSLMFEQAVDLALQGFAVFPLAPGTKRPMFKNWEKRASTDPRQIASWWNTTPNANIAIACGPTNLLVIDLDKAKRPDGPRHGEETLAKLAAGRELPRTFTVASARGGRHLYYRQPDGAALSITTGSDTAGLGPLVDTRGHGGFIVAPGSLFEGGTYRVEHDAAVAPLPTWIADQLTKRPPAAQPPPAPAPSRTPVTDRRRVAYGNAALKQAADTVARAPEGTRNDTLNRESFRLGRLVGGEILDRNDAAAELRRAAHQSGLPPGEAAHTIASGLAAGIGHPRFIPDPATSPQTSQPTKEAAMTTVTDQEPRTPARSTTTPATEPVNTATHTAQPVADDAAATTANEHEATKAPQSADAPAAEKESSSAADSTSSTPHQAVTQHDPTTATESEFDFDDIWNGVRASIERARQAIPDWIELGTLDDLKPAIDEALRYLAQTPIPRTAGDAADSTTAQSAATNALPAAPRVDQSTDTAQLDDADLDGHLAAVDAAYAHASGIPVDRPEWAGISAIHSAVHNLWDTLKATAGTYWAELSADVRVRGLLTTLATRAARTIANLANAAATHLEQRGTQQQPGVETQGPDLRAAYINARNQVRAHAATHEWQRITALWGTVNTLARQAGDPGIRAVIARSADAISDYADTLGRKTSQDGHTSTTDALTTLAAAAERHAASLRADGNHPAPDLQPRQAPTAANAAGRPGSAPTPQQGTEAQLLQARARQVAQHAQARLGQTPRTAAAAPHRARGTANPRNQNNPTRPTQPSPSREPANIHPR
ncbi:bifunctional DNA primase/polymerase [Actinocrinis puniceicyclus]|uniref:Bifunctional DNA primase/polymerase n=1 Tax=Actinocrinis puniceicyclus TaxID=977794 RepID=A0A8J8BDX6_9ACTN|nr:DUF6349 family protein [Actinocrinis puniceicyclus]MBS2964945.1 bifunctional DNA primase/polymerase [Actinocrinis puniceicyclus]